MSDLETQSFIRQVIREGRALDVAMELLMVGEGGHGADSARVTLHRAGVRWHPVAYEFRTKPQTFLPDEPRHAVAEARAEVARDCLAIVASVKGARHGGKNLKRAIAVTCEEISRRIEDAFRVTPHGVVEACSAPTMAGGRCLMPRGHGLQGHAPQGGSRFGVPPGTLNIVPDPSKTFEPSRVQTISRPPQP